MRSSLEQIEVNMVVVHPRQTWGARRRLVRR
jgi:hypothetical protein